MDINSGYKNPQLRYAAIDIGTVTSRMLIADAVYAHSRIHIYPLNTQYTITDLGEDVDATGFLKPEAIERVEHAMKKYLAIRNSYSDNGEIPIKTVACATSASRDASNSSDFEAMMERLGIDIDIIPGERESELSFIGATNACSNQCVMVVDVGGGSTEIAIGHPGCMPNAVHSFDIGSRRLTERFFSTDKPSETEIKKARSYIRDTIRGWHQGGAVWSNACSLQPLSSEAEKVTSDILHAGCECIAVAGTATSVVSVSKGMDVYDSAAVHGTVVSRQELEDVTKRLASLPLAQRKEVVGLDPGRAPVIVAGLLILEEVLNIYEMDSFTASEADILQGMVIADFASILGSDRID